MDDTQGAGRESRAERRAHWQTIVAELEACGETRAAFCRRRGIPGWKLAYWRKALAAPAAAGFVEVAEARADTGVSVEAGRWRVRVEAGFDAATLLRTLRALGGA